MKYNVVSTLKSDVASTLKYDVASTLKYDVVSTLKYDLVSTLCLKQVIIFNLPIILLTERVVATHAESSPIERTVGLTTASPWKGSIDYYAQIINCSKGPLKPFKGNVRSKINKKKPVTMENFKVEDSIKIYTINILIKKRSTGKRPAIAAGQLSSRVVFWGNLSWNSIIFLYILVLTSAHGMLYISIKSERIYRFPTPANVQVRNRCRGSSLKNGHASRAKMFWTVIFFYINKF